MVAIFIRNFAHLGAFPSISAATGVAENTNCFVIFVSLVDCSQGIRSVSIIDNNIEVLSSLNLFHSTSDKIHTLDTFFGNFFGYTKMLGTSNRSEHIGNVKDTWQFAMNYYFADLERRAFFVGIYIDRIAERVGDFGLYF